MLTRYCKLLASQESRGPESFGQPTAACRWRELLSRHDFCPIRYARNLDWESNKGYHLALWRVSGISQDIRHLMVFQTYHRFCEWKNNLPSSGPWCWRKQDRKGQQTRHKDHWWGCILWSRSNIQSQTRWYSCTCSSFSTTVLSTVLLLW